MSQADSCEYLVWAGSYLDPPEYCPNDVDPEYGEGRWCVDHLPPPEDDEPDYPEPDWWDPVDFYEGDIE